MESNETIFSHDLNSQSILTSGYLTGRRVASILRRDRGVIWEGQCGENVYGKLTKDGLFVFSLIDQDIGSGTMYNWTEGGTPWYKFRHYIKEVIIEKGVDSIGNYAFYNCTELRQITIPSSVKTEGVLCFGNCVDLKKLTQDFEGYVIPTIADTVLKSGQTNNYYSDKIIINPTEAVCTIIEGTFPPGLTLSEAGKINGYPTEPGEYTFTVRATMPEFATYSEREFTIVIYQSTISRASLSLNMQAGASLSLNSSVTNNYSSYSAKMLSIEPQGDLAKQDSYFLYANQSFKITFKLTANTKYIFASGSNFSAYINGVEASVIERNDAGTEITISCILTSTANPVSITTSSLPNSVVGDIYSAAIKTSPAGCILEMTSGALPKDLIFEGSTIKSIQPLTKDSIGEYTVKIKASPTTEYSYRDSTSRTYTFKIVDRVVTEVYINIGKLEVGMDLNINHSVTLGRSEQCIVKLESITYLDGPSNYQPNQDSYPLRAGDRYGLGLEIEAINNYTLHPDLKVYVNNSKVDPSLIRLSDSLIYAEFIQTMEIVEKPVSFTTSSLSNGLIDGSYSAKINTNPSGCTFELVSGALPDGLELSSGGTISGIPTKTGTFSFTVKAVPSQQYDYLSPNSKTYSIKINPRDITSVTLTFSEEPGVILDSSYKVVIPSNVKYKATIRKVKNDSGVEAQGYMLMEGREYTVTFALSGIDGYQFSSSTIVKVNEKACSIQLLSSPTEAEVAYTFVVSKKEEEDGDITVGVEIIQAEAYRNAVNIEEIIFPATLKEIQTKAFYGCVNLKRIEFQGNPPINGIADDAFVGVEANCYIFEQRGWETEDLKNYGGKLTWYLIKEDGSYELLEMTQDEIEAEVVNNYILYIKKAPANQNNNILEMM